MRMVLVSSTGVNHAWVFVIPILANQRLVAGQEGLLVRRAHISEDDPAQLLDGIRGMADAVLEDAALGLSRLLQAAAIHVVDPAVEGTAEATVFDTTVLER